MAHEDDSQHEPELAGPVGPTTPGGLDVPAIALVGAVGILLLIVIAIAAQAWFYDVRQATIAEAQYAEPDAAVESYLAEQHDLLNGVRWVEGREGEAAAIPIERAMEIYAAGR